MKNDYEIRGNDAIIFVDYKDKIYEFVIDLEDLEKVAEFPNKWAMTSTDREGRHYVSSCDTKREIKRIYLHRLIMNAPKGTIVDHINNNTLDNRKSNLRFVTHSQNGQNRTGISKANRSGIRGVGWNKFAGKWSAYASENGKKIHLGYYKHIEDAETAAIEWRKKHMPFSEMDK